MSSYACCNIVLLLDYLVVAFWLSTIRQCLMSTALYIDSLLSPYWCNYSLLLVVSNNSNLSSVPSL